MTKLSQSRPKGVNKIMAGSLGEKISRSLLRVASFLFLFVLLIPGFVSSHGVSFDQTTREIMKAQGVSEISDIDCQKTSDDQFEVLGDAIMGIIHPSEKDHDLMDQMMGGEGSQSLKAMHILMGKRYLGCVSGAMGMGMMNMMGTDSGMGMGGMGMGYGMMGTGWGTGLAGGNVWFAWIFQILFLTAIILVIIALAKWISKK